MRNPHQRHATARVGSKAGKYTLERLIDVGGMAAVYEGRRWRSRVAIKVMHRDYCLLPEAVERFSRESYCANQVTHPDVPQVIDDGKLEDGTPFFVMELLEGGTLEQRLVAENVLSLPEVLDISVRVLDVLGAAHARGVIHRDINPGNVFLTTSGAIKVLDFGLARMHEASHRMTRTGTIIGTASYMSPEQALRDPKLIDARTDLWSVGAILFRALAGRTVHAEAGQGPALIAAATQSAPSLGTVVPSMPAAVVRAVDRALAFKKDDRFPDAASMLAALRAIDPAGVAAPTVPAETGVATGDSILVSFDDDALPEPSPGGEDVDVALLDDLLGDER